ncbi:MAG: MATE family efflux transporter [Rubritepida sp.]|nr:MATE family efflux transporter [Rubritepida sp.]
MSATGSFGASVRRLMPLAWPVFVGQISVLAFGTVDTLLVARHSSLDLAALAIGAAAYITIFIGFMGVVLALAPIVGQLFGAHQHAAAGRQVHQAVWIALAFSLLGSTLLAFPQPFLALSQATPEIETRVRGYLLALAFSLPASLLFTVYRGFNTAVSRPKAVMALQLGGLALKVPLSVLLVFGLPALGVPELGVVGCGIATCIAMWAQCLAAFVVLRRDDFYAPFALGGRRLDAPDVRALAAQLRLGIPMGLAIVIEVTGFTFMAFFIARLGTTAVAGHQIAANLAALLFMMSMAIGNAASTLVAQSIGARDEPDARRLGWHGLALGIGVATLAGGAVFLLRAPIVALYSGDPAVQAAALSLVAWLFLVHVGDAAQSVAASVLRAWRIATVPLLIYAVAIWGVGLGGGYWLAFGASGTAPRAMQGAPGFWIAAAASLVLTALALVAFLAWMLRQQHHGKPPAAPQRRAH